MTFSPPSESDFCLVFHIRAIKFAKPGLEFVDNEVPAPGPNEVRIKVKAIGINRAEAMWRVDDFLRFEPSSSML